MTRLIEAMAKHLPPSASTLHLLDLNGAAAPVLTRLRPDISVTVGAPAEGADYDAVVAFDADLSDELLADVLVSLRPGGRLIVVLVDGAAERGRVARLEAQGYVRIYVAALEPAGVLLRGERRHLTADTTARIQSVASRDASAPDEGVRATSADPSAPSDEIKRFKGRFVHLLIRQMPNKPVWALRPDEVVTWQAVAVADKENDQPQLLAFSSLPNAVAFMQPAVIAGTITDVNKVAKFSRETARDWQMLVNPTLEMLHGRAVVFVTVDPRLAEAPDE